MIAAAFFCTWMAFLSVLSAAGISGVYGVCRSNTGGVFLILLMTIINFFLLAVVSGRPNLSVVVG